VKVLWIVNTIFPELANELKISTPFVGGWMFSMAKALADIPNLELGVATVYSKNILLEKKINEISYFLLPSRNNTKYDRNLESFWKEICDNFDPDIIHIHGSEYAHGLACKVARPNLNYIISIQGLIGPYSRYFMGGMSFSEILKSITLRDLILLKTLWHQRNTFINRGKYEIKYYQSILNIIGRTDWDLSHAKYINTNINYYFCNESLRNEFYESKKWDLNNVDKYSIFLSQAHYPLKGAHNVIKAISGLVKVYPSLKLRIGGYQINKTTSLREYLKLTGYGKFINQIIRSNNLEDYIEFLGPLNEDQMIEQYQKSHVFICPSSIENSSNSIGEAQIIGTPVIASFVGGGSNMIEQGISGFLFRFEEIEMLNFWIRSIFDNDELSLSLSKNSIKVAEDRHDRKKNLIRLKSIYDTITI
jgi:glycosyltransferase involved in cell wall biosynthesis